MRLWQNLNVLFFLRALTEQMSKKSSEPVVGHVKRKIGPLYFNKSQHSSELSTPVLYPDCEGPIYNISSYDCAIERNQKSMY